MMRRRSKLGPEVRSFYRKTLRIIYQLEYNHQATWYDYLRLKLTANADIRDDKKISKLLAAGHEELELVSRVLEEKRKSKHIS
jgi:hypothetical protein